MKRDQLARHGEMNGRAKLTTEDVIAIRDAARSRDLFRREAKKARECADSLAHAAMLVSNAALARKYGVTEGQIRAVLYNRDWTHVR